jgi:hypothetical protein
MGGAEPFLAQHGADVTGVIFAFDHCGYEPACTGFISRVS